MAAQYQLMMTGLDLERKILDLTLKALLRAMLCDLKRQNRREPHRGPGKQSHGAPKHFTGSL